MLTLVKASAIAALLALSLAAPAAAAPRGTDCGLIKGSANTLTFRVYARNISCATARRVFRRTVDGKRDARGWTCIHHEFRGGKFGTLCRANQKRRIYGIPTESAGQYD
jgi:hypothetical protein